TSMRKRTYFDTYWGDGWPQIEWLEPYFLTPAGRRKFFEGGNDSWGLKADGIDGTEHRQPFKDRIDIDLTILGHPDLGILLFYHKTGGGFSQAYYSEGDMRRLHEWVRTVHGDRMPIGLYIPFETAWKAVKEFVESDGSLPQSIEWIAARDLPDDAFPSP